MKKISYIILVLLLLAGGVLYFSKYYQTAKTATDKRLKIVTTLFPLYDLAKNIGQDKVEVTLLLPPGVEPHSFEPKPSDIVKINDADIFIYTGKFMEPWAEDIIRSLNNKNIIVVDASQGVNLISENLSAPTGSTTSLDPHIWLDFDNYKIMAANIKTALMAKDSANSAVYEQNTKTYDNKLTVLDNQYRTTLATCQNREIVYGGHYAFGYLARRYNLKYLAAQGLAPDAEPTAQDLMKLVEQINSQKIKTVFYEELTSPKIAETIAQETGAKLLLLNAAHNLCRDQLASGLSFLDIMATNLINLKAGLNCR